MTVRRSALHPFIRHVAVVALVGGPALAVAAPADAGEHPVAPGENLSGISRRYCMSLRELVDRNGVTNPDLIHIGTRLEIIDRCATRSSPSRREVDAHLHLVPMFRAAADEFGVPPDLLMALTFTESRWRADRVSASGAAGIGQLLPDTADWLRALMHEPGLQEYEPEDNVRMSARLLRFLLERTEWRTRTALAAYYQGIGDVLRNGISERGRRYASLVLERRAWFADL